MKSLVALVGTQHIVGGPIFLASLPSGEPLVLKRDPTNPYDKFAIEVWARDHKIGFVKSSQNRQIAVAMDARIAMDSAVTFSAKLETDGGHWPMVEIDL